MLRDEVSAWVIHTVSGSFRREAIDAAVQALNLFLDIDENIISEEKAITEMAEASDLEKPQRIRNFSDIERFMKSLCEIVDPDLMKGYPQPLTPSNREWMLANMYREAFHVLPDRVKTKDNPDLYRGDENYIDHYLRVYQFRNSLIHDLTVDLSAGNLQNMIISTLVVKLDLCLRNVEVLRQEYRKKQRRDSFDGKIFAARILERYRREEEHGFGYVDVHWVEEGSSDKGYSVEKLLAREELNCVKLLGEAGTGKSTALQRIEYVLASRYKGKKTTPLPVYIELGSLADGDAILKGRIASLMNIREELAEDFLASGELCLLLDGYNEILDTSLKRNVAKELDYLYRTFPKSRIFLTDRAISRAGIPTLYPAKKLYLYPMTMEDRKKYFETNCQDPECRQMILRKMETEPGYFEAMNTPLKLKQLLRVAVYRHELPVDITNDYIEYLMEREQMEKKDENIEYLPSFLQALAILQQDQMTERDALVQMAKCKNAFGFSLPDTRQCLKLAVDMGLLVYEDRETIGFANPVYQEYFFMEGVANQLDELI
ncbi:MAG: NACHT domain-containing protein [bacterium]|nr:NACHT domain-containing protein [bacterium]